MKYFLAAAMALMMISSLAQDTEEDLPAQDSRVRSKIQAARIAYITDQLDLTPAEAEKFWPIYREFSAKRRDIRLQLRDARRNADANTTTEQADQELVKKQFEIKQEELNLEKDYSARLLKVISAQKLRALPEAERKFRRIILDQIQRRKLPDERRQKLQDTP